MTQALLAHEIDGALVDNYVLTHSLNLIQEAPIRIERYVDHQITYGMVLAKNSSKLEKCVRKFLRNHPQEVFEIIASNLVPLKVRLHLLRFLLNAWANRSRLYLQVIWAAMLLPLAKKPRPSWFLLRNPLEIELLSEETISFVRFEHSS